MYTPVIDDATMWLILLEDLTVNNKSFGACSYSDRRCVALVDTGSSFLGIDERQFSSLVQDIQLTRPDCNYDGVVCK